MKNLPVSLKHKFDITSDLSHFFWPEVEQYLNTKKSIILPVGSTEQHGPTGAIGIDALTAHKISLSVGQKSQTLVAPSLSFGMAEHHMGFPGTISLTPTTYVQVLEDIFLSLNTHGFEKIIVINGHGGNIAPLQTAFCQIQSRNKTSLQFQLFNWWHLSDVTSYEEVHFKNENGFHATCGEISVSMVTDPKAYTNLTHPEYFKTQDRPFWPMGPKQFRSHFPDGRMGSNPALASSKHGEVIFNLAVNQICRESNF